MARSYEVLLNELPVGVLDIGTGDTSAFRIREEYLFHNPRPVLGQTFEEDLRRVHKATVRLPPFFSNLLPEGALRQYIARSRKVKSVREWLLLDYLGGDLPGAVIVRPVASDSAEPTAGQDDADGGAGVLTTGRLRFSLAGVQLKLSMLQDGDRFTLPMRGTIGRWLVKLPDRNIPNVPETEFATLMWADRSGIPVPEHRLVAGEQLVDLPEGFETTGNCLAVRRFDRRDDGSRVHQEDFAQILGVYSDDKYSHTNYESLGRIILAVAGADEFLRYVDYLMFVVLSGNTDAHLKNWSLRYENGYRAALSPAYDQIAVVVYPNASDDRLALRLGKSTRFEDVTVASLERLARAAGCDESLVRDRAGAAAERIRTGWQEVRDHVPLSAQARQRIEEHLKRVPVAHHR